MFGRAPPDYVVAQAISLCEDLGITSLKEFPKVLRRTELREKFGEAYRAIMPVDITPEYSFLAALYALKKGEGRALKYIRKQAQREFDEIDRFYRREMLSSLSGEGPEVD